MCWSLFLLFRSRLPPSSVPGSTGTKRGKRAESTCVDLCYFCLYRLPCSPVPSSTGTKRGKRAKSTCVSLCYFCLSRLPCCPVPGSTGTKRGKRAKSTGVGLCYLSVCLAFLAAPFQAVPLRRRNLCLSCLLWSWAQLLEPHHAVKCQLLLCKK